MADVTFTIAFKDDGTPVLKNIQSTAQQMGKGVEAAGQQAASGFSRFQTSVTTLSTAVLAGAQVLRTLASVASTAIGVVQGLAAAAAEAELAETKRAAALRASGQFTAAYVAELDRQAAAFSSLAAVDDEVILGIQQQLVAFGASRGQMEQLTQATLDLAAGMGGDLASASLLVGKAVAGEFGTLSRYGILVDENASKSAKLAQALAQIEQRFGGQATAQAQSYAGQVAALSIAWGNLQEALGGVITQNTAVREVIGLVTNQLQTLQGYVEDNEEALQAWVSQGIEAAIAALPRLVTVVGAGAKVVAVFAAAWEQLTQGPFQGFRPLAEIGDDFAKIDAAIASATTTVAGFTGQFFQTREANRAFNTEIAGLLDSLNKFDGNPQIITVIEASLDEAAAAGRRLQPALRDLLQQAGVDLPAAFADTAAGAENAARGLQEVDKAAEAAAKKIADANKAAQEETALYQQKTAILQQVVAGTLTLAQAQEKIAVAELRAKGITEANAQAQVATKAATEAVTASIEEETAALKDRAEALQSSLSAQLQQIRTVEDSIAANERETRIIREGIAAGKDQAQILTEVAVAAKKAELDVGLLAGSAQKNAEAFVASGKGVQGARKDLEQLNTFKFDLGKEVASGMREVVSGILQGTRKAQDILGAFKDIGVGIFANLFARTIESKLKWEVTLSNNLLNDLPRIFGQGGQRSAAAFQQGFNFTTLQGTNFQNAQIIQPSDQGTLPGIFSSTGGAGGGPVGSGGGSSGGVFGSSFGTSSGSGAGDAFGFAAILAEIVQAVDDFKKGKYGSGGGAVVGGAIAGYFSAGNPQAIAAGAAIGRFLGSFLDPLFKHIPTKGSLIRTSVKKYLKEIDVSFAKEIDSADYFFAETKALADKLFGGDFLVASKQVLTDKAGPELAAQLQALGTFLTADQAIKKGKSVEQTGTTFGNLLLDNLGLDAIPDAIAEIVSKGGLTLESLTGKLTEVFQGGKIGAEFYKTAILGAVDIFHGDLPEAIGVSKIALKSFTDDGIFSLSTFNTKVEEATGIFDTIGKAAVEALRNSNSGADAARIFGEQLQKGLEELAVNRFIDTFINERLFAGIDLSDGLGAEEIALLTTRVTGARVEIDALRTALKETDTTAGQTGETLTAIAQSAAAVFNQISLNAVSTARSVINAAPDQPSAFFQRLFGGSPETTGSALGKKLGDALRAEIATSVTGAIQDAIIQVTIQDAILAPFKEALAVVAKDAFADGILTPAELAKIVNLGQVAADAATDTAKAIAPVLTEIERGGAAIQKNFEIGADAFSGIDLNPLLAQAKQFRDIIESTRPPTLAPTSTPGFATGGYVSGSGSGDSVPALLTPGEYVLTRDQTRGLLPMLAALESGMRVQHLAGGGLIGPDYDSPRPGGPGASAAFEGIRGGRRARLELGKIADIDAFIASLATLDATFASLAGAEATVARNYTILDRDLGRTSQALLDAVGRLGPALAEFRTKVVNEFLAPIRSFIGLSDNGADAVAKVREEYATLTRSLTDHRAALTKAGVDVDSYLAQLANALPQKIREALEAANQALVGATAQIGQDITSLLQGAASPLSAFDKSALLAAQETDLRGRLGTASNQELPALLRDLSGVIRGQIELAPFDRFSEDYQAFFVQQVAALREVQHLGQARLDQALQAAGVTIEAINITVTGGTGTPREQAEQIEDVVIRSIESGRIRRALDQRHA